MSAVVGQFLPWFVKENPDFPAETTVDVHYDHKARQIKLSYMLDGEKIERFFNVKLWKGDADFKELVYVSGQVVNIKVDDEIVGTGVYHPETGTLTGVIMSKEVWVNPEEPSIGVSIAPARELKYTSELPPDLSGKQLEEYRRKLRETNE